MIQQVRYIVINPMQIQAVFFNGLTAQRLFNRHVANTIDAPERFVRLRLPSTSPAHAAMSFEKKLQAWMQINDYLKP